MLPAKHGENALAAQQSEYSGRKRMLSTASLPQSKIRNEKMKRFFYNANIYFIEGEPSRPLKYCSKNVIREFMFSILRNKETIPTNEPWTMPYDEII